MNKDCCFTREDKWFRYRAAAIIVEDDCVLFVTNEEEDYYYSVGGGVHLNESAEDAVLREVFEETGIHYEIDRLAVVHENFFVGSNKLEGYQCHEIAFYYLMKSRGTKELNSDSYSFHGVKEEMCWLPIKDLDKYEAYPAFMKEYLQNPSDGVVHIVTRE